MSTVLPQPPIDAPDEEWLVYGDALQVVGDPRGELIALVHAGKKEAVDRFVEQNAEALLGKRLASRIESFSFLWRWCLPTGASILIGPNDNGKKLVKTYFASKVAKKISRLSLVGTPVTSKSQDLSQPPPKSFELVDLAPVIKRLLKLKKDFTTLELIDQRAVQSQSLVSRRFHLPTSMQQSTSERTRCESPSP